eukprot:PhF_6_TR3760/c0_g1_i2/m.5439
MFTKDASWIWYPFDIIVSPDDDYVLRSRKFIISMFLFFLPVCLFFAGAVLYDGIYGKDMTFPDAYVAGIVVMGPISTLFCVLPYAYVYKYKTWSEDAMDLWLLIFLLIEDAQFAAYKTHILGSFYFIAGFVVVMCRPRHLYLHAAHCILGYSMYRFNVTVYDRGLTTFAFRFDGAFDAADLEPVMGFGSVVNFVLVMLGLRQVLKENDRATQRATGSVRLCSAVSESMVVYDTDAARNLLETLGGGSDERRSSTSSNSSNNDFDEGLRVALLRLVSNLEMFRPHLPEYVWLKLRQRERHCKHEEEESNNLVGGNDPLSMGGEDTDATTFPAKTASTKTVVNDVQQQQQQQPALKNVLEISVNSKSSNNSASWIVPNPTDISLSPFTMFGPERIDHAYYAVLDFTRKNTLADLVMDDNSSENDLSRPAAVRQLVNWAHMHALRSRGTLHSFTGDTIHATWCFHTPSVKPALFLGRMYRNFTDDGGSGLYVSGGLAGGTGISYMAGDRRQAYILHVKWREVAHRLHRLGRDNCAALMDEHTYLSCRRAVVCRWVDVIPGDPENLFKSQTGHSGKIEKCYEFVVERSLMNRSELEGCFSESESKVANDPDDVPSYAPGGCQDEEAVALTDPMSLALTECLTGKYDQAIKILRQNRDDLYVLKYSTTPTSLLKKLQRLAELMASGSEIPQALQPLSSLQRMRGTTQIINTQE